MSLGTAPPARRIAPGRLGLLALLAGPTIVAAVLVLWGIGDGSLWRDEVASATITGRPLGSMWHVIVHHEANMALYDLVLHPWQWLGHGDGFLRLPGAAFAIATVPVTMLVARRLAGDVAAAVAGGVVALNGFVVIYGQQVRGYSLTMLLSALAGLTLLRALDLRRPRDWVAWTLVAGAVPYGHVLGALVVVALVASLALHPWGRLPLRPLLASLAGIGALWLPLVVFLGLGDHNRTSWVGPLRGYVVRQTAESVAGDSALLAGLVVAALLVVAAAVAAARRARGLSEEGWRLALPVCWAALPPVLLAVLSVAQPTWVDRYLIGIVPALGVLAGVAVTLVRDRVGAVGGGALALVLGLLALHAAVDQAHPQPPEEDLRGAAAFVASRTRPGDEIVYAPAYARVGLAYYLDRGHGPRPGDLALRESAVAAGDLFGRELGASQVAARMASARRLWVAGYGFHAVWHPTPEPVDRVGPAILARDFHHVARRAFGELVVDLYVHD